MLVIQRTEQIDVDHAIPPVLLMGSIVETGTLGYEEKKTGFFVAFVSFFFPKEERTPAEGEIFAKGSYTAQGEPKGIYRIAYPQKNKNLPQYILIDTYHVYYKWKGNIMFSGKSYEVNFLIDADGIKSGNRNKTILLDTAKTEFFRLEFSGAIGYMTFETLPESGIPSFPWCG
jgi:hypothetical protein